MLIPFKLRGVFGLQRRGPMTWQSCHDDPHFRFRFRLWRPRHLILILDGVDTKVEPVLYLDTGDGYDESQSIPFARAGRFVFRFDLHKMPDLRSVRLDPLDGPGRVRLVALATPLGKIARFLLARLSRSSVPSGPTRIITLDSGAVRAADLDSGLRARRYRGAGDHYADVITQQRDAAVPVASAPEPVISFLVPTYNTKTVYLDDLLRSFEAQPRVAEIIFSDDGSRSAETLAWLDAKAALPGIRVVRNRENRGIAAATNAALAQARAPWVALIDHDDALAEGAVAQVLAALAKNPQASFLYTDEVIADAELRPRDYFLKPAYDPVLLSGVNYINHLSFYRRERLRAIGGFREGFNGSQDYDLVLRYLADVPEREVLHLPYPAYIWRRHPASFSTENEDGAVATARKALAERYARPGRPAELVPALMPSLHRVVFETPADPPRVSVVIPNRDSRELMATVFKGLSDTAYPNLDVIVVDNDTTDPSVFDLYAEWQAKGMSLTVVEVAGDFNFSRSVNAGIERAEGDLILLLNNDIEMHEPGWLSEMVSCFAYPDTGVVGARLLYPDGTLQHAGVIVGLGGLAGHWYCGSAQQAKGPMGRLTVRQSLSAVTGAAMLISRACLEAVGEFDESLFAIAYNDIDFCLRARECGFRVVWTPFATLTHHESKSRGSDEHPSRIERFRREQQNLRDRHGSADYCDPAFNPWYTRDRAVPGLRALDVLPEARYAAPRKVAEPASRHEVSPQPTAVDS